MSIHPVTFEADFIAQRSRLTTFFRLLLAIPLLIVGFFWGIAVFFAVVIAWFAIVFTGAWPRGLYDFVAGFQRFNARANAYAWLLADPYPPFDGAAHPEYPVRLNIGPPKESYSRARTALRLFLLIPVWIIAYVLSIIAEIVGVITWLVIVVSGKQAEGLHSAMRFTQSYTMRAYVYTGLISEEWPSFDDSPALGTPSGAVALTDTTLSAPEAPAPTPPPPAAGPPESPGS